MSVTQRFLNAAREGRLWWAVRRRLLMHDDPNYFLKKCRGVIHVGANHGAECHVYGRNGLKVVWIEPIPDVFQLLVENIRDFPDQMAINALITNEDGALCTLHISNNSGESSSILDLHLH